MEVDIEEIEIKLDIKEAEIKVVEAEETNGEAGPQKERRIETDMNRENTNEEFHKEEECVEKAVCLQGQPDVFVPATDVVSNGDGNFANDSTVVSTGAANLKRGFDDSCEDIIDYLVSECKSMIWLQELSDGKWVLLTVSRDEHEQETCQLKLYCNSKRLLSKVDLPLVISADTLSDSQIIVPIMGNRHLQIVDIVDNKLTTGGTIKTRMPPALIQKYSESSMLVGAFLLNRRMFFQIIDTRGHVTTHIFVGEDLLAPLFMRVSNDGKAFYVLDAVYGCYGFSLEGDTLFHYIHQYHVPDAYVGLALDLQNFIFIGVAASDEHNMLIKLSSTGKVQQELAIDGVGPLLYTRNTWIPLQCEVYEGVYSYVDAIATMRGIPDLLNFDSVIQSKN